MSGAAIHQRIQKLMNIGVIKGSEFVIDADKLGYQTCAYIGIFLKDADEYKNVVNALLQIPEIVECHFTTGPYSLLIKLYAHDNEHLMELLSQRIQNIEGVISTETLISLEQSIRRSAPII